MSLRQALKHLVGVLVHRSGVLWVFVRARAIVRGGGQIRILTYHGVSDSPQHLEMFMNVSLFDRQMRYLKQRSDVIPLKEAARIIASGRKPKRDKIVITFDDGYKDNYVPLFPILRKYGLPATIYLATGYLDEARPTFVYLLMLCIDRTSEPVLDLSDEGLGSFPLRTSAAREQAIRAIDRLVRARPRAERDALARTIAVRMGFAPEHPLLRDRMLSWDEVREMSEWGVEFGAHTVTHPVLSALADDEAAYEIAESRRRIEQELGQRCLSFAYPYGGPADLDDRIVELVRKAGFSNAVVLHSSEHSVDRMHRLGRVMVSASMASSMFSGYSQSVFACEVSGFFDWLLRR